MNRSARWPQKKIRTLRHFAYIVISIVAIFLATACSRTPSNVISPDDMAEVMADMYIAESVVEMNRHQYVSDSSRRLLRQSVLEHHGFTSADFDTSMVWYGHNYSSYLDVCDRTIEILQKKSDQAGTALMEANVSFFGDSVDIWSGSPYLRINNRIPSRYVKFGIDSDENSEAGDIYTWRVKLVDDQARSVRWFMLANYSDSTTEYLNSTTSAMGWNEMTFITDSTRTLQELSGYFEIIIDRDIDKQKLNDIWIDSISLVRKRVNPDMYDTNRYRLRRGRRME